MPMAVLMKEEPDWEVGEGSCGVSAAAARAGLYAGHEVKGELVLGPERLQPPDIAAAVKRKKTRQVKVAELKPAENTTLPCEMCRRKKDHFKCDYCLMTFSTKSNITKHLLDSCNGWNAHMLHKKSKKKSKKNSSEKEFLCPKCTKSFNLKTTLLNHMAVHNTNKPYKCDHCARRFKKKGTLIVHERTHTGEKPYKCRFCAKLFRQQTSLNNHLLVHSGTKPHACQICHERFTQVSNLTQHIQNCHKTEAPGKPSKPAPAKPVKLIFY